MAACHIIGRTRRQRSIQMRKFFALSALTIPAMLCASQPVEDENAAAAVAAQRPNALSVALERV